MLTAAPERGAKWTGGVSRAAFAHQTAPTSPGRDPSAAPTGRPTRTSARCWRRSAKGILTWMYSTRESARVRNIPDADRVTLPCICQMLIPFFVLQFKHNFTVFTLSETCRDVLCPGSSTCVVDQTNNAYCVTCNRICPEVTSPEQYLCGNDGIIYASACHLRRATCLLGRSIGVAYEGKCISKSSTGHHFALQGIVTVLTSSAVVQRSCFCQHSSEELVWECVCLVVAGVFSRNDRHLIVSWCWQNHTLWEKGKEKGEWVQQRSARGCGAVFHFNIFESDGLTNRMQSVSRCYLHYCFQLRSTICTILNYFSSGSSFFSHLKHFEKHNNPSYQWFDLPFITSELLEAKSCEDIQCSAGKKCLWDARMTRGRCSLCDETCPESRTDEAVCASDNTTYPSECAMKQAACSMGVLLEVKHAGSCNCK